MATYLPFTLFLSGLVAHALHMDHFAAHHHRRLDNQPPMLAKLNEVCPAQSNIFNGSPTNSAGEHTMFYKLHATATNTILMIPIEVEPLPDNFKGFLQDGLEKYASFMQRRITLSRTVVDVPNSEISEVYTPTTSYANSMCPYAGSVVINKDLVMDAVNNYYNNHNTKLCTFNSIAFVVNANAATKACNMGPYALNFGLIMTMHELVLPFTASSSDLFAAILAHELGHQSLVPHNGACELTNTFDPLGFAWKKSQDTTELCASYGSKYSIMGINRDVNSISPASPCWLISYGSIQNSQVKQMETTCTVHETNANACNTGIDLALAPYDMEQSNQATNAALAILTRQTKPIQKIDAQKSFFEVNDGGRRFTCQTEFSDTTADWIYKYVQQANGCSTADDKSLDKDVLVVGYIQELNSLDVHVWKGKVYPEATMKAFRSWRTTNTEWATLSSIFFSNIIRVDATPETTTQSDGFVTVGSTLSSCNIGNDLSNNIHLSFLSTKQCNFTTDDVRCADIKINRNNPTTYSWKSIGAGYCPTTIDLPEGAYPDVLPSTDSRYSTDRKTECLFRCLSMNPHTIAFSTKITRTTSADETCTCSVPNNDCKSPVTTPLAGSANPTYWSIGAGYCSDWEYLPEGAYPDLLQPSQPLYNADRVEECLNRCVDAYPNTIAFYVKLTDGNKCACSSGACSGDRPTQDKYYSYRKAGCFPDLGCYESFSIEKDQGTVPKMTGVDNTKPLKIATNSWKSLEKVIGFANNQHLTSLHLHPPMFYATGGADQNSPGLVKIQHPGLFKGTVMNSDMKGRVHSIDYLVMSEDASSPNEAQTSNTGSILGMKNRPLTTALGFTATLRVPDDFAPTEDKVATVMHWRGLFVSLIFSSELWVWIATTKTSIETFDDGTRPTPSFPNGMKTSTEFAGQSIKLTFTSTNYKSQLFLDGELYCEILSWPKDTNPIDAAKNGKAPTSHPALKTDWLSGMVFYNFWLTKEAMALVHGGTVKLTAGGRICNEVVETETATVAMNKIPWVQNVAVAVTAENNDGIDAGTTPSSAEKDASGTANSSDTMHGRMSILFWVGLVVVVIC